MRVGANRIVIIALVIGALQLSGCGPTARGEQKMSALPVQEIYAVASTGRTVREKVALELGASWPIPIRRGDAHAFAFFYYGLVVQPPQPRFSILTPAMQVEIDATGVPGAPVALQASALGLHGDPGQPFAMHAWPAAWTQDVVDAKTAALLAAYDRVLPLWQSRAALGDPVVQEFRSHFLELTEPPLLPWYRALGPEFFGWLQIR